MRGPGFSKIVRASGRGKLHSSPQYLITLQMEQCDEKEASQMLSIFRECSAQPAFSSTTGIMISRARTISSVITSSFTFLLPGT